MGFGLVFDWDASWGLIFLVFYFFGFGRPVVGSEGFGERIEEGRSS